MAQVVLSLPCKHKIQILNLSTIKRKEKKGRNKVFLGEGVKMFWN
jgi:hypothetical protein